MRPGGVARCCLHWRRRLGSTIRANYPRPIPTNAFLGWGISHPPIPYPPTRVIVGEVRSAEALDLLLALNSGLPGMATLHANSAREALVKLYTLPMLAGENISSRFVVPTVAASVDLIVHLGMGADG